MDFQIFIPLLEAHKGKMIFVHTINSQGKNNIYSGILVDFAPWFFLEVKDSPISSGNLTFLGWDSAITSVKDTEGNFLFENPLTDKIVFPKLRLDTMGTDGEYDELNRLRIECFGPGNEIKKVIFEDF